AVGLLPVNEPRSRILPWREHFPHGSVMTSPKPRQVGHVSVVIIRPKIESTGREICPAPRHVVHVSGCVPGSIAEPSQRSQRTAVSTSIVFSQPKTASSRSISVAISASCPRRARDMGPPPPPPPKNVSKISENPPKPPPPKPARRPSS